MKVTAHHFVPCCERLRPSLTHGFDLLFVALIRNILLERRGFFGPWDRQLRRLVIGTLIALVVAPTPGSDQPGEDECKCRSA